MESAIAQDGTRSDVGSQLRNTTREITNKALEAYKSCNRLINDRKWERYPSGVLF